MKTPLPEKMIEVAGYNDGNRRTINQLIDYLAKLTTVVEGTLPARSLKGAEELVDGQMFTLKTTLLGEIKSIGIDDAWTGTFIRIQDVEAIINRLMP